jgi:hypothetical protein
VGPLGEVGEKAKEVAQGIVSIVVGLGPTPARKIEECDDHEKRYGSDQGDPAGNRETT